MARMSNRDRIERAAAEARLADAEKQANKKAKAVAKKAAKKTAKKTAKKKTAKKATKRPRKTPAKAARMKVVWVVYTGGGKPLKTYAYPDKDAGMAEAQRLSSSTGQLHELRAVKVPME